jgi:hypothetical protein
MDTAQRLRAVRAAHRRFLTLWAVDHPEAFVDAAIDRHLSRRLESLESSEPSECNRGFFDKDLD